MSLSPRRSALVAWLPDKSRLVGTPEDMESLQISLLRRIGPVFGPWCALQKPSTCPVSQTLTNYTTTFTLPRLEPVSEAAWEVPSPLPRCLKTAARKRKYRTTSSRKRERTYSSGQVQTLTLKFRFINTVAGWVNLLLMSSSGPVKIPVGAW